MKKILYIIIIMFCVTLNINADDNKSFKCEGTTYASTGRLKSNSTAINTGFNWSDSKGKSYPIYMSVSGSCYIIKISAKSGKEYKQYMKPDISQDICKKLGKEYKSKKK